MTTAFGPQGANVAVTLPPAGRNRYGDLDTWFADCTTPTANDATVLDAQFLNNVLGNLRTACRVAAIELADGDMTMLHRAIVALAAKVVSDVVEAPLITAVGPAFTVTSGTLTSTLGSSGRVTLTA